MIWQLKLRIIIYFKRREVEVWIVFLLSAAKGSLWVLLNHHRYTVSFWTVSGSSWTSCLDCAMDSRMQAIFRDAKFLVSTGLGKGEFLGHFAQLTSPEVLRAELQALNKFYSWKLKGSWPSATQAFLADCCHGPWCINSFCVALQAWICKIFSLKS